MNTKSKLGRSDYEDYLVYLYFRAKPYNLSKCIKMAYLDFSRTLHGLGEESDDKKKLYGEATKELEQRFLRLQSDPGIVDQVAFDNWHRATYQQLFAIYNNHGYNTLKRHLFVGQAQKWINMTFKYLFTLGELGKYPHSGFGEVYPFCHAPLDRKFIEQLEEYGILWPYSCTWSRLDSYDKYRSYQQEIRQQFADVPLDVEFLLWMGMKERLTLRTQSAQKG